MKKTTITALLVTAAFGSTMTPAFGQVESSANPENETQVYAPDYFTQFAPQTAADMVARLPGFEIRGREGGERGFGQASLNILINGRRPSSKSSGANQILQRIPANNVTRIEIVDGATLDIPGLSGQVANIIAKTGELSGSWNYAMRFEEGTQPQLGDGGISFSAKRGRLDAVGSLDFGQFTFTENGDETFFDGTGNVFQNRIEKLGFNSQRPGANLNLTYLRDNGDVANLNLSGRRQNRNITIQETFEDLTDDRLSGQSVLENGEDRDRFEISGDYSLDVPAIGKNGRLKLIGLHRTDTLDLTNRLVFGTPDSGEIHQSFLRDDIAKEFIGRAEYTWKTGETNDWSLALEGALNSLESDTEFSTDGIIEEEDNIRVEEDRLQANLSRSWALNARTNIQTSIGAEYSVIDVTTDDNKSDSFFRPKGLANLSYKLTDSWTLRGQIERSVGQLDFGTFVSTVNLNNGTATSGGNIMPEQKWQGELELQKQNSTGLSGRAKLFYDIVEDPIDQILFDDGTQGPENLDSNAKVYGIEGNVTWVLDDVLKGLRLSADGILADSSIRDVITSERRSMNRQILWNYDIQLRWDIEGSPFAIETELEQGLEAERFRIDERTEDRFDLPEFEVAFIHKDLFGMQWTAKIQNIFDFELRRERFIFDETRNGDLLQRELTRRTRGQRFSIEVTDTF
ncbi:MAG: TonB-dependent receptor plug domain-containing protein [Litorimonas sp.]